MFLPVYYIRLGLGISDIAILLLITFMIIGFLPTILLKFIKNFERVICFGVLSTMVFYMLLMYVKNPILLGVAYGLSIATFWPSFNLLQFRLSESKHPSAFSKPILHNNSVHCQHCRPSRGRTNYRKLWFSRSTLLGHSSLFYFLNLFHAS